MLVDVKKLVEKQKEFYLEGKTRNLNFRIKMLKKLQEAIKQNESEIINAGAQDLHKPDFEAYTSEVMNFYDEINLCIKKLNIWAKPLKAKTPLVFFKATSRVYYEPYGVTLIIGTWNYPFMTTLVPLIGAIAAGNCSVIKTSELAPASAKVVAKIIKQVFDEKYCAVVTGAVEETTALLNERFDLIFFTGSPSIGRIIARAAVEHLTPTILELGGKSPCIVDESANIAVTAKRITWGKFMNAGQICTTPDYLIVHKNVKKPLLEAIVMCIKDFYGNLPQSSPDYCRIVNVRNFDRISKLLNGGNIVFGGKTDKRDLYIEPTIIDNVTWNDPVMQEEIFGPLLPVMEYEDLSEVLTMLNKREKPLALYFFSENKQDVKKVIHNTSSGGVCINATLIHVMNPHLPFGGIGNSGMGNYHGKYSFESFSHKKSIVDRSVRIDPSLVYAPYKNKLKKLKRFF